MLIFDNAINNKNMKPHFSFRLFVIFFISLIFLITCHKDRDGAKQITQKEENIIKIESKLLPDQLLELFKSDLTAKQNSLNYNEYLDTLTAASEELYNALVKQDELQEFKDHLSFLMTENSTKKSSNSSVFSDCNLARLGLGYAEGISISSSATAGIALILLKETESEKERGYKIVYDFVNLERQIYYFSVCNLDSSHDWSYGLGVALKAGLGFTGYVELISGLKNVTSGESQLSGPSIQTTYSLEVDVKTILELFGITIAGVVPLPDEVSYALWKKRNGDCTNTTPLNKCPEYFGSGFSGIEGCTVGVGGSIDIGVDYLASFKKSEIGICSEQFVSNLTYSDFGKSKFGRVIASHLMATELILPAILGISISLGPSADAAADAVMYGLGDPANCQIINTPPNKPTNLYPSDKETNISTTPKLEWACSDPENDGLTYDLYFGASNNPPLILTNLENSFFQITALLPYGAEYYWKVIAYDDHGNSTTGPVWSFTTVAPIINNAPVSPSSPSPGDGATGVGTSITMTWNCSDPESDPLTYDVYFGTSNNPTTQIATNIATESITRSGLTPGITYYWKVVAKDNHTNSTEGPIWRFTIGTAPDASFSYSPNPATVGQSVQFTNLSSNNATSWEWEFGDGKKSTVKDPAYTYSTAGSYTVGLTAYNNFGWGAAAGTITVNPAVTPTIPTVTTTAISGISQTTATTGGNVTSIGSSDVIVRGVCWSTSANPTTTDNVTTDGAGAGSYTSNIIGLTAGTTYHVRAYARNNVDIAYGVDRTFTTNALTQVPPTITTTAVSNITQTTATTGGNVTSIGSSDVIVRGVCWSTSANPTTTDNVTTDGAGTGSFTSNITGLTAGTTYHVRAYAINSAGTAYGSDRSFTTLIDNTGTVIDIDNNVYNIVKIGGQWWMAENLKSTKYNDGTIIPLVTNNTTWSNLASGAYCWYNNNSSYENPYGKLYNWYTVNTGKLCPAGWHVPSYSDWIMLTNNQTGGNLKESGTIHWLSPNAGADNLSGFSGLPGGYRGINADYFNIGTYGAWWSASEYSATNARNFGLTNNSAGYELIWQYKYLGMSVRCIQDGL